MGWDCAGCGSCCESIRTTASPEVLAQNVRIGERNVAHARDLADALGDDPDLAVPPEMAERLADSRFLVEHLVPVGEHDPADPRWTYRCTAYDPETRLCGAHDERPAMCASYRPQPDEVYDPDRWRTWPGPGELTLPGGWPLTGAGAPLGCSYRWDGEPGDRGPVVGRLLPLWAVPAT